MPRTSTSFKPGHTGMGGRPKGSRKGATNAWRKAATRAREVGRRADDAQSNLLGTRMTMVLGQLTRFAAVIRKRRNAHIRRSKHVRPIFRSGGVEIWFGNKIVPKPRVRGDSPGVLNKRDRIGEEAAAGAVRAAKKVLALEQDLETLHEAIAESPESRAKITELTNAIVAFEELCKAEKVYLEQSGDPRPRVKRTPIRIIFVYGPAHDSLRPEYRGPLLILGGRTGAEFYGGEEKYNALLEAYYKGRQSGRGRAEDCNETASDATSRTATTLAIEGEQFEIVDC